MLGIASSWAFLVQNPIVGLAVFVLVSAGVVLALSEGRLGEALGGMFRVAWTLLSTPFVFLRDAMTVIRTSEQAEEGYAKSRVFMLFRLNRIQYLGLLIVCLIVLSSGITSSLLTLYPQDEINRGKAIDEQIQQVEQELQAANAAVSAAVAPDASQVLEVRHAEARSAYQRQVQSNQQFVQSTTYTGSLISQLANTRSTDTIARVRQDIDFMMSGCPNGYNWRGMTANDCVQYRGFILELAERKEAEISLSRQAQEAETAWRNASSAAQEASNRQAQVQAQLEYLRQQQAEVSLWNPEWMAERFMTALGGLLMTLLSVILTVWFGATVISLFSWIILMMRSMEKSAEEKIDQRSSFETLR